MLMLSKDQLSQLTSKDQSQQTSKVHLDLTKELNEVSEAKCVEVEITASSGGRVQIVKFDLSNEFQFGYTEKYTIPTSWSKERLEEWKEVKTAEIKKKVDEHAQVEQDALLESSDWYRS